MTLPPRLRYFYMIRRCFPSFTDGHATFFSSEPPLYRDFPLWNASSFFYSPSLPSPLSFFHHHSGHLSKSRFLSDVVLFFLFFRVSFFVCGFMRVDNSLNCRPASPGFLVFSSFLLISFVIICLRHGACMDVILSLLIFFSLFVPPVYTVFFSSSPHVLASFVVPIPRDLLWSFAVCFFVSLVHHGSSLIFSYRSFLSL